MIARTCCKDSKITRFFIRRERESHKVADALAKLSRISGNFTPSMPLPSSLRELGTQHYV
jgi:hypothetical protein